MSKENPQKSVMDLLKELGLSDKESLIYVALLKEGSAKAVTVARKTGINRTTVYDLFDSLLQRGLIGKSRKKAAVYFNALGPKHLLTYLDREKEEKAKIIDLQKQKVEELLPAIISLQNQATTKPKVMFFEGEKGMREAYEDTLNSKETILAYANVATMNEGLPNFFPEYYKRRAAKKIFIKGIMPQNGLNIERSKFNQEEMRDVRFLPSPESTFSPEVNIYNNIILIVSWKEKMALIIESKELADLQKVIFNLLWNALPRTKIA
ncbi:MAG: helix-turn-helix domain-containing protein [Patescibacteria group bacterium]